MARNLPQVVEQSFGSLMWQIVQLQARAETAEEQLAAATTELEKLKAEQSKAQES